MNLEIPQGSVVGVQFLLMVGGKFLLGFLPADSGIFRMNRLVCFKVPDMEKKPKKVFVVHGEDSVCDEFTECLRTEHGFNAEAPYTGASYDLIAGEWLTEGNRKKRERRSVNKRNQGVFDRLIAAGKRLMTVIQHNEGGANKDLAKFADQINALCDKWDR